MSDIRLPPDVFEAVVNALRDALVAEDRTRFVDYSPPPRPAVSTTSSPWLTIREAGARAKCGTKTMMREAAAGRLRAVRVGGRRSLRLRADWIDEWLESSLKSDPAPPPIGRAPVRR